MIKFLIIILFGLTATIDLEKERQQLLYSHNHARKYFKFEELTRSSDLEKIAQDTSEYLLKHPENLGKKSGKTYKGSKLGENIYVGNNKDDIAGYAIDAWIMESDLYYEDPTNYEISANFTQVVWKSTKLLGCGISCNTKECYVVCNYYPAGNIINEYEKNVIFPEDEDNTTDTSDIEKEEDSLEKFRKEITEKHNYYRKQHNTGELERDSKLEKIAQEHAEYMLETDSISFTSKSYFGEKIGQNLFYSNKDFDAKSIVDQWYSKKKFYDSEEPYIEGNKSSLQFINLIWKNTKKIGCGYACKENECFAICTYYPCGGCEYLYSKNVLPKSSEKN